MSSIHVSEIMPGFGARVVGIDNRHDLKAADVNAIESAMAAYAVVVLPDQSRDERDQVRFTRHFGGLELPPLGGNMDDYQSRVGPELFDAGNIDSMGHILPADAPLRRFSKGNALWHTDSSFNALPVKWSLLMSYVVTTKGGETEFCDTRLAYESLSPARQEQLKGLRVVHDLWHSRQRGGYTASAAERERRPSVTKPLLRRSQDGRQALYIGEHAAGIVGWPKDEGRALLRELMEIATQPDKVYTHRWTAGDLVIWDNRCTLHRVLPYDSFAEPRDLRRTTCLEVNEDLNSSSVSHIREVDFDLPAAAIVNP